MDVEDGVGVGLHHFLSQKVHETGQHHQIDAQFLQLGYQGLGHGAV